ncbi:MAG: hypothetical protein E6K68_02545 [Nitrospirae bacterium]|nr:MAG: hypothetical protein E6K68_02545 [Nitrospirota bacterium]
MSNEPLPIKITVGGVTLNAELKPTRTAKAIYDLLPIETDLHSWGEEFYFKVPFIKDHRETATVKVAVGDIAYWGNGGAVAIFFGRTPVSTGSDPAPADRVNLIGKVNGDATVLRTVLHATTIRMEQAT